jgi:hypothetical protein
MLKPAMFLFNVVKEFCLSEARGFVNFYDSTRRFSFRNSRRWGALTSAYCAGAAMARLVGPQLAHKDGVSWLLLCGKPPPGLCEIY